MKTFDKYNILKLLEHENKDNIVSKINEINNTKLLHIISENYNWDNGFEIPYRIVNNKYCDLGTALMIFYDADGYRLLNKNDEETKSEWYKFISFLYKKILNNEFKYKDIKFTPNLNKVQVFKLNKLGIFEVFLNGI